MWFPRGTSLLNTCHTDWFPVFNWHYVIHVLLLSMSSTIFYMSVLYRLQAYVTVGQLNKELHTLIFF